MWKTRGGVKHLHHRCTNNAAQPFRQPRIVDPSEKSDSPLTTETPAIGQLGNGHPTVEISLRAAFQPQDSSFWATLVGSREERVVGNRSGKLCRI